MTNAEYQDLPQREQLVHILSVAARMFGPDLVLKQYRMVAPAIRDMYGHGNPEQDPSENYWGGVWKIHIAE